MSLTTFARSMASNGRGSSLSDPSFDLLDPTPDIRSLFIQFNDLYFDGLLAGCEVRWSPRMTLCAGQCHYEGFGGLCSVRLSEPLLKFRPRKDLVETLLHEMIHALLFVTQNNKDHDGHGPEFQKHMRRINDQAGINITVYHSFHGEVAEHRQHWWRCKGPCRERPPYHGWVKRATNRAPSSNDFWWADHQKNCGGEYEKVKEPEGYKQKGAKSKKSAEPTSRTNQGISSTSTSNAGGNSTQQTKLDAFFGEGHVLGTGKGESSIIKKTNNRDLGFGNHVRSKLKGKEATSSDTESGHKRASSPNANAESSESAVLTECPVCSGHFLASEINSHLDVCLGAGSAENVEDTSRGCGSGRQEDVPCLGDLADISSGDLAWCPVCSNLFESVAINDHLDVCLN